MSVSVKRVNNYIYYTHWFLTFGFVLFEVVYWHTSGLDALTCRAPMVDNRQVVTIFDKTTRPMGQVVSSGFGALMCTVGLKTYTGVIGPLSFLSVRDSILGIKPPSLWCSLHYQQKQQHVYILYILYLLLFNIRFQCLNLSLNTSIYLLPFIYTNIWPPFAPSLLPFIMTYPSIPYYYLATLPLSRSK